MKFYQILFGISVLVLLAYILFLGFQYQNIPQNIPIHYSGKTPDCYGDKIFLWLEVGINVVILILIGWIIFHQKMLLTNTQSHLESSQEQALKNRQTFLSVLGFISTLLLCGISFFSNY